MVTILTVRKHVHIPVCQGIRRNYSAQTGEILYLNKQPELKIKA